MIKVLDFKKDNELLIDSEILDIKFDLNISSIFFKVIQFKFEEIESTNQCTEIYYFQVIFKKIKNFKFNYGIIQYGSSDLSKASYLTLCDLGVDVLKENEIRVEIEIFNREMII